MVRSSSDSDSRSSGKVQQRAGAEVGLVGQAWNLAKQLFFTVVHVYKSLTAFWSQMHVCMLPALGELDNEGENPPSEEDEEPAVASTSSRKSTKVN